MSTKVAAEPNPILTSERRGYSRATLAIAAGTVAILAAAGAHFGFGIGNSTPSPAKINGQTESTLPSAVSTAIDAYINAVAAGEGTPPVTYDTAAATNAYVHSYPEPGLKTHITGR